MGAGKSMRLIATVSIAVMLVLCACSETGKLSEDAKYDLTPAKDSCKDFPAPIYPNVTSKTCEKSEQYENTPINYTAYLESKDSVAKVTKYYKTQVSKYGWKAEPKQVETSTHAVVVIKKGIAYASITINTGKNKKGSSFQIHAYPFGN